MDSPASVPAPIGAPPVIAPPEPGSEPLRNTFHERFAVCRAAMFGLLESAREAGNDKMTAGNAAKVDRNPRVRERIKYLAGDTAMAVQRLRAKVAGKLNVIRDVSLADFIRMEKDPEALQACQSIVDEKARKKAIARLPVLPFLDLGKIARLVPEEQREILSAVKSVTQTENGPKLELHSPLEAIAQLRKMHGLDEVEEIHTRDLTLEDLVRASYAKQIEQLPQTAEAKNE